MTVDIDWTPLQRGLRRLDEGVTSGAKRGAMTQAQQTAARIRTGVPVRTGALRATVDAVEDADGAAVTYGGTLRYAAPIAARTGVLTAALDGAPETFYDAMHDVARREVTGL